ncbi:laminin subunit beta-4-like isoform X2 [Rhinatrema bivittatum]|uniref:laminin subunit beta-4-like isoform X2 n=1 Tax=Rhinatrema bivittatum TaxID=194408 RepID=UPI00112C38E6|nr:laminin subunit beta-4-like isoform X2 [Rhinatrema bivittatum]XP_029457075.1 laminin subunit beta-4-like isoform X2 [Rhinatrema bivittatum]XP_029457076.1 laminin subunit beta-4-like isoform X2 [Rhinatrema bivittatum]XP_029457077.1 laminin subunit beta-4-like isoform X2 [Rhinatrema bivittatum]
MRSILSIFLLVQVQGALTEDPDLLRHGCTEGSCYPATGNLLIGRAQSLSATSTCGLEEPQDYCIVSHLQDSEKCFSCDSRASYLRDSHQIQNVIYLTGQDEEKTWWQSENGVESVSIRLDLEAEFHFTHLIIKFKTFRPAAMLIERSADFGHTWKVYRYFSYNCTKMFPGVPINNLQRIDDIICDQRYSDIEPSSEGEVIFKVLDPAIKVEDPYSLEIQELLQITNLRINFTKLHTLGDNLLDQRVEVLQKYYYAVYELVVRGSCFCYGHASECSPIEGVQGGMEGMIHGRCVCKHHTKGLNCELCKDFYHDLPWRPAEANNPHSCKQCNCNNHSWRCHFDMAVYLATGRVSSGVCHDCQHNTMGRSCELCKPFYYRNPRADIRAEAACIPCDCDPLGSLEGGVCDTHTDVNLGMIAGQCRCKENVKGERCDSCKESYYGLSRTDPMGCQPCRCDPRGIILGSAPCEQISGDCYCKRYVTGRHCNQCLTEFWGLSNDITGCRPCACDFGGSYNNRCSMEIGQCDCRPHIIGRQCEDVQPGYFCMPLDYYTYEAENARGLSPTDDTLPGTPRPEAPTDCVEYYNGIQNGRKARLRRHRRTIRVLQQRAAQRRIRQLQHKPDVEIIRREHIPGVMITWTGLGFARVKDGAGLLFHINNIPYPMDYDIMIRYEPESAEDWEALVSVSAQILPMSPRCGNVLPSEQMYSEKLPHTERYIVLPRPFCFENNNQYEIAIRFQRSGVAHRHLMAFILIDSLVLLPKFSELPGFHGNDPASVHHREEMERYMCLDSFKMATMPTLAEMCIKLVCSISAIIHDGALSCQCDLQGSTSAVCDKVGGQCKCKPNVIGRRCDQCAPGTYGFGPYGCSPCNCHFQGSVSKFCDPSSGQCQCQRSATGRQCDQCMPGQWGFPNCRPCQCNGRSEECDPRTGTCIGCRDYTSGRHCDRCLDGYYGDPVLGSGQQCRPCPCPGYPGSRNYHGTSCHADKDSNQIICLCAPGYTGSRCDRCSPGYFGTPEHGDGECRPCQCNNNIDPTDPESCDPRSGQCLSCLHNTDGPHCAECKPGYYGSAIQRTCRRCTCNQQGTLPSHCSQDTCYCDRESGHCPCRANVVGKNCDQCAPNFWNFGGDLGCEPCACDPRHSLHQGCNMFTGQCHCQPGFGGRVCAHCQEEYWGNPGQECQACNCHPSGSETMQCDRSTGQCFCREGFIGQDCGDCSRGFQSNFPSCTACHPCFGRWDLAVSQLLQQLRWLKQKAADLLAGGPVPEISSSRMKDLENKLAMIQHLIGNGTTPATQLVDAMAKLLASVRADIFHMSEWLNRLGKHLDETGLEERKQKGQLELLNKELRMINTSVYWLKKQLECIVAAGFNETYNSFLKYYLDSGNAENLANTSVYGPGSPVAQSRRTRHEVEGLLKEHADAFQRNLTAHKRALRELQKKTQGLNVIRINEKICGVPGDQTCDQAPCGGANCRDKLGNRRCGGENCHGALPVSSKALNMAQNISRELENTATQLTDIAQKIQEIQGIAKDAKGRSEATLSHAQDAKRRIEDSTNKLRSFIKKIKDFLTEEGADPESIELVARQVLNISLPSNASDIAKLVQEIRDSVGNLSNVEKILNYTSESLVKAKEVLNQAMQAKAKAEGVKGNITEAQNNLRMAKTTVKAAEKALRKAEQDITSVENVVKELSGKIESIEGKEMAIMDRLGNLSKEAEALREKTEANRQLAKETKEKANRALSATGKLEKEMKNVNQKYTELQDKVGGIDGLAGGAMERVKKVKDEAEALLKKATNVKEKLDGLEKKFQDNEKKIDSKLMELQRLEEQASGLLEHIRQRANAYATCEF